ncbi:hypothetical protein [Chitinophaga solisilvae]|uniref:hypothetical protein n=1 Tax=Chitinophaga solisilvae TaxID=1233460 RepID=UPI001371F8C3|nr:hypothetical protein [Chitinophaga solisilvae]
MKSVKGLYLSVPTPCGENWDKMLDTAAGKYCSACEKTVIDFSLMTDAEMLAVITNSQGNVCGRFYTAQLERHITAATPARRNFIPAALLSAGMMISIANDTHAEARQLERTEMEMHPADTIPCKKCMTETVQQLPELVVTGLAMKKQVFITGAVSVVDATVITAANKDIRFPKNAGIDPVYPTPGESRKSKKKRWFF